MIPIPKTTLSLKRGGYSQKVALKPRLPQPCPTSPPHYLDHLRGEAIVPPQKQRLPQSWAASVKVGFGFIRRTPSQETPCKHSRSLKYSGSFPAKRGTTSDSDGPGNSEINATSPFAPLQTSASVSSWVTSASNSWSPAAWCRGVIL